MRSVIFCVVLLSLLALCTARNEMNLAQKLVKKSLIATRQLTGQCSQAVQTCANTMHQALTALQPTDPNIQTKACSILRTLYDCIKNGTASCHSPELSGVLNDLLTQGSSACPTQFQGASVV